MSQEYYYKATGPRGRSGYDSRFVYHLGLNVHPNPDKSPVSCSEGLHLGKTILDAVKNSTSSQEVYLARAGVILGEDESKVRCTYVWLDRQLTEEEIEQGIDNPRIEKRVSNIKGRG